MITRETVSRSLFSAKSSAVKPETHRVAANIPVVLRLRHESAETSLRMHMPAMIGQSAEKRATDVSEDNQVLAFPSCLLAFAI